MLARPSNRPRERGALLHHYGGPWVAHALRRSSGGARFEEVARFDERPSKAELARIDW